MKAVRKLNDAKKLEGTLTYDSSFGDGAGNHSGCYCVC